MLQCIVYGLFVACILVGVLCLLIELLLCAVIGLVLVMVCFVCDWLLDCLLWVVRFYLTLFNLWCCFFVICFVVGLFGGCVGDLLVDFGCGGELYTSWCLLCLSCGFRCLAGLCLPVLVVI